MKAYQREFIEFALNKQVLKFGEFTLKSGALALISSMPGCLTPGWIWRNWAAFMLLH